MHERLSWGNEVIQGWRVTICFLVSFSTISSPTIELDNDSEAGTFGSNRRSSTTVLLSPDVDVPGTSGGGKAPAFGETSENDGFYLLKKDSQRRMTLSKVLQNDEVTICEVWIDKLRHDHKFPIVLTKVKD